MNFCRVAGLSFRNNWRSFIIQGEHRVKLLPSKGVTWGSSGISLGCLLEGSLWHMEISEHIPLRKEEDSELTGGITYPLWPGNIVRSTRRSCKGIPEYVSWICYLDVEMDWRFKKLSVDNQHSGTGTKIECYLNVKIVFTFTFKHHRKYLK